MSSPVLSRLHFLVGRVGKLPRRHVTIILAGIDVVLGR